MTRALLSEGAVQTFVGLCDLPDGFGDYVFVLDDAEVRLDGFPWLEGGREEGFFGVENDTEEDDIVFCGMGWLVSKQTGAIEGRRIWDARLGIWTH